MHFNPSHPHKTPRKHRPSSDVPDSADAFQSAAHSVDQHLEESLPKGEGRKSSKAETGFEYCNRLFKLEEEWSDLSHKERCEKRLEKATPLLDEFWVWISTLNALEGSNFGKAVTYARNQKEALMNFLLNGGVEISNNRAENAIRPFVTGRKNWLFSDTSRGAQASATV